MNLIALADELDNLSRRYLLLADSIESSFGNYLKYCFTFLISSFLIHYLFSKT